MNICKEIIVTGGRDYRNYNKVKEVLDLFTIDTIIQGGASGADSLAASYAIEMKINHKIYKADWTTHGRAAGPLRNKQMLDDYPNALVIAFPGGKGTENCIKQALSLGRTVLRVETYSRYE